jgi:S-adenosylmethionine hydrolase
MYKFVFMATIRFMKRLLFILITFAYSVSLQAQSKAVVFQSDFGLKDGAVSAMKGVAYGISNELHLFDLTHEIPAYNIWEAAYRLNQAAPYWPAGTVFISVVDPGVGSSRKSIVAKTKSGHYFVTPDNGTLTLIAESLTIVAVREIDEVKNRRKDSQQSYTFHGRDVYAYTGARLAAGIITFDEVGPALSLDIIRLPYQKPVFENGKIQGMIDILDVQFGNIWTNIDQKTLDQLKVAVGDKVHVKIFRLGKQVFEDAIIYGKTFADVPEGKSVCYMNSLLNFSIGINQGNFAQKFKIASGTGWSIELSR